MFLISKNSLSQTNTILQSPQTISRTSRYSDFPKEGKAFLDEMKWILCFFICKNLKYL